MPTHDTGRLDPSTMLNGRYLIGELAGKGGMGAVYKATDTLENYRTVAIKELSLSKVSPEKIAEARANFRAEAEMLSRLSHRNLPKVYDFFDDGDDRSYLVMEFIQGKTLRDLLVQTPDRRLAVNLVIDYALQLCEVLSYLHAQAKPIVFRDLKPVNVMVTPRGQVYLIDFGIARIFKPEQLWDTISMGTPGFSPPEQFRNHTTPRSDLYSLGATLYYCLSGFDPRNNTPNLFSFRPVRTYNQSVPPELDKLIQQLVATEDTRRPVDAAQVMQTLQSIQQWAAAGTSNFNGALTSPIALSFYDPYKARATQFGLLLSTHLNKLPGIIGTWSAKTLIPFLSQTYSLLTTWFVATFWPWLTGQSGRIRHAVIQWYQNALRGNSSFFAILLNGFRPPVWRPYFVMLFLLLPLLMIGGSFYMAGALHWSLHQMALAFCLPLSLFMFFASFHQGVQHALARSVLLVSTFLLLLTSLTLVALPDVQQALLATTMGQAVGLLLILLASTTFLRPLNRFAWLARLTVLVLVMTCLGLQLAEGPSEWPQFSFIPAALDQMVNLIAIGVLVVILLFTLLRFAAEFERFDRFLFLLLATLAMALQFAFGLPIVSSTMTMANPVSLLILHILFGVLPFALALLWLLLPTTNTLIGSVPLVVLTYAYVPLLLFLANHITLPFKTLPSMVHPLQAHLQTLLTPNQLLFYLLLALAILLLLRISQQFTAVDRFALFSMAIACVLLQTSTWNQFMSPQGVSAQKGGLNLTASSINALYGTAWNNLVTIILDLVVGASMLFLLFSLFIQILPHIPRLGNIGASRLYSFFSQGRIPQLLEHLMILMSTIACIVLQLTFGPKESLLAYRVVFQQTTLSFNVIVVGLLALLAIVELIRLGRAFSGVDRFILLIDALVCVLLLFNGSQVMPQQVALPHLGLPALAIMPELLVVAVTALLWLRRSYPQGDKNALLLLFGLACATALLQLISPVFLLVTLFLLIQGTLLATRIEAVH